MFLRVQIYILHFRKEKYFLDISSPSLLSFHVKLLWKDIFFFLKAFSNYFIQIHTRILNFRWLN